MKQQVINKTYEGKRDEAFNKFQQDQVKMAELGYFPLTQNWVEGKHGCLAWIGALMLCVVIIGLPIIIYMLIVKPDGSLNVTYELRKEAINKESVAEKTCPKCAENVKLAAKICRYCGHDFD